MISKIDWKADAEKQAIAIFNQGVGDGLPAGGTA
jgi:hypothetical protein